MPADRVPTDVVVRALVPAEARTVTTWRYEGPWSVYDGKEWEVISAELGYHAIVEQPTGRFLGYVCFGPEARVPGLEEEPGVLDVGIGLDPAIVGRGRGRSIVAPVLDWIAGRSDARELGAVVQQWNERALRLCQGLGFGVAGHHVVAAGASVVDYVILRRPMLPS